MEQILSHRPQKESTWPNLGLRLLASYNHETTCFCCVSHSVVIICFGSPSEGMQSSP